MATPGATDDARLRGRLVRELVLEQAGDVFEALVALVEEAGMDQKLADVAPVPVGRELVQQLASELP
ncbi:MULTISPECIES: hypothetical protein [Streptomyces]|uniref:hypothetical protein n=1 Tax=Streptomyces TaxID=1883 RepID=UPI00345BD33F